MIRHQLMKHFFAILAFVITLLCIPQLVHSLDGIGEGLIDTIQSAITRLAPRVSEDRARRLAGYIKEHSEESEIDPLLVTAIIMRESSFSHAVQTGRKVGRAPHKCVGLMQIHPWGPAHKLGGYLDLTDANANIRTGVMWLEYVRGVCGDTHWQWVAAYGMSRCPTYHQARRNAAAITARRLYCKVNPNCETTWPAWERRDGKGRLWYRHPGRLYGPDPYR